MGHPQLCPLGSGPHTQPALWGPGDGGAAATRSRSEARGQGGRCPGAGGDCPRARRGRPPARGLRLRSGRRLRPTPASAPGRSAPLPNCNATAPGSALLHPKRGAGWLCPPSPVASPLQAEGLRRLCSRRGFCRGRCSFCCCFVTNSQTSLRLEHAPCGLSCPPQRDTRGARRPAAARERAPGDARTLPVGRGAFRSCARAGRCGRGLPPSPSTGRKAGSCTG